MSEHVHSRSNYQMGKCPDPNGEGCRKANAEYKRDKVATHRELTASKTAEFGGQPLPSLRHGKAFTHDWYGCRCGSCVEAAREKWRESWRRKQVIKMVKEAVSSVVPTIRREDGRQ